MARRGQIGLARDAQLSSGQALVKPRGLPQDKGELSVFSLRDSFMDFQVHLSIS